MITDADIVKLKKVFLTKEDLKIALKPYTTKKELEVTTIDLIKYIGEVRTELKSDILSFKDQILSEIIKLREDVIVTTGYRQMIEDHENRLNKLDSVNK